MQSRRIFLSGSGACLLVGLPHSTASAQPLVDRTCVNLAMDGPSHMKAFRAALPQIHGCSSNTADIEVGHTSGSFGPILIDPNIYPSVQLSALSLRNPSVLFGAYQNSLAPGSKLSFFAEGLKLSSETLGGALIFLQQAARDGSSVLIDGLSLKHLEIDGLRRGVSIGNQAAVIVRNVILKDVQIRGAYRFGILLGTTDPQSARASGEFDLENIRISHTHFPAGTNAAHMYVAGTSVRIKDAEFSGGVTTQGAFGPDHEGLYLKCRDAVLKELTFVNCPGNQAALVLKGSPPGEAGVPGYNISAHDINIMWDTPAQQAVRSRGVWIQTSQTRLENLRVEGFTTNAVAINQPIAKDITLSHLDLKTERARSFINIAVQSASNIQISNVTCKGALKANGDVLTLNSRKRVGGGKVSTVAISQLDVNLKHPARSILTIRPAPYAIFETITLAGVRVLGVPPRHAIHFRGRSAQVKLRLLECDFTGVDPSHMFVADTETARSCQLAVKFDGDILGFPTLMEEEVMLARNEIKNLPCPFIAPPGMWLDIDVEVLRGAADVQILHLEHPVIRLTPINAMAKEIVHLRAKVTGFRNFR